MPCLRCTQWQHRLKMWLPGRVPCGVGSARTCCLNFWTVERSMKSVLPLGMRQLIFPSSSPANPQEQLLSSITLCTDLHACQAHQSCIELVIWQLLQMGKGATLILDAEVVLLAIKDIKERILACCDVPPSLHLTPCLSAHISSTIRKASRGRSGILPPQQ